MQQKHQAVQKVQGLAEEIQAKQQVLAPEELLGLVQAVSALALAQEQQQDFDTRFQAAKQFQLIARAA